jgi:hypothetical protein
MVGKLLCKRVASRRKIDPRCHKSDRINLRNHIFEFEMRAAIWKYLGEIPLRKNERPRIGGLSNRKISIVHLKPAFSSKPA